ncbi:MAG: PASTA domain-containing protein [Clostridia bacterium]|nr:PASTA domain-containing protein [Clostridia bacterium]
MEENKQAPNEEASRVIHPRVIRRGVILMGIAFGLLGLLLLRILLYQTVGYGKYQQKVIDQMTTESSVIANRGNIYDANGTLLATNVTTYRVFIAPSAIASAQTEMNRQGEGIRLDSMIADELADILSVSVSYVMEQTSYTNKLDRTIKNKVDEDTADLVREAIEENGWHQFVHLQATSTRYYPYSSLGAHVLGFTGSDGGGLYGLEFYYDEQLAGTNGRYIIARDAQGNEMPYGYEEFIAAEDGYHLNTTIDVYVQAALEEQVKNACLEAGGENRAAGVVMDVNTGGVLGMAIYPNFDLNDPWTLDQQSESLLASSGFDANGESYSSMRQALLLNMWSNKAITESYIPGSTFKVITAAMVLEEAVVTVDQGFDCPGYKVVSGRTIRCHKLTGHGHLNFTQGIQQSCNPVLMSVGLALGQDPFYDYLGAFGYLEKTQIDLPGEGTGVFASRNYFTELDLAIYAFGQNFNVTLMQQITAVSAVANGGYLVQPHFLSSITDSDGNVVKSFDTKVRRQVVSAETCKTVADILEKGVSGDGGAKNAYVTGYRVAAKTGTSEKKEYKCPKCDSTAEIWRDGGKTQYECSGCRRTVSEAELGHDENGKLITKCPACAKDLVTLYTCSICGLKGVLKDFDKSEDYVCSTVAFAPAENPRYAVIIMVDEPTKGVLYGSVVAAPYVANVMEKILPYLGVEAIYTEAELEKMTVTVPKVVGWSANAAKKSCEARGLEVEIIGETSGVVKKMYPEGGTTVEKTSGKVILYTTQDETQVETLTVPDLVGMTATAANQTLVNKGFNIRILGTKNYTSGTGAVVVEQSVAAGTQLPRGSVIEVTFRYLGDDDYNEEEEY